MNLYYFVTQYETINAAMNLKFFIFVKLTTKRMGLAKVFRKYSFWEYALDC